MFDVKQTAIIKQALQEYEDREAAALVGDEAVKYQFTNHFEEQAQAIKKRVLMGVKVSVKRVLLLAAAVVLVLSVTVAMVAGSDMHVIRFGNDIDYNFGSDDPKEAAEYFRVYDVTPWGNEKTLDIPAMIIESELPIPEGYECSIFNPLHATSYSISYRKDSEKAAYGTVDLSINIYEIYENTHVRLDHDGDMLVLTMGDLKIYHYDTEYLLKAEKYAVRISTNDSDITDEEIIAIFESIDKMMNAPMRSEEEIRAEIEEEPSIAWRTGWSELEDWEDYNLDFSAINYRLLTLPEGYKLRQNALDIVTQYQKFDENGLGMADLEIEMIDLTVDPYISKLYVNPGNPVTVGDITLYSRPVGYIDDHVGSAVEYVYTAEKYAIIFHCETWPQYGAEYLPTPEELAVIVGQINDRMAGTVE